MSANAQATVYVIDDDADVRESLQWLLESIELNVKAFDSAISFLAECPPDAVGCIVMDVRMPKLSGLNAQKKLAEYNIDMPVIMISAHGSINMAVTALTDGAMTFLEKPFDDQALIDHVQAALEKNQKTYKEKRKLAQYKERYNTLTRREKEVFELVVQGHSNQEIADIHGINRKTVEGHRANTMSKMAAQSLAELVQIAISLGKA